MKIRTLIVDDEPLARQRLRTLLAADVDAEIAGECGDGLQAVAMIHDLKPDLVFLDVQMPALDGFGVLAELDRDALPLVIFVTAHDRFALKAFEVHALDYLLKPYDKDRFAQAFERAKIQLRRGRPDDVAKQLAALLESVHQRRPLPERLVVRSAGRVAFVRVGEINWIEAAGNYVRLHVGKEEHLLRETLGGLEAKLDPGQFVRIHRSIIVNWNCIRELQPAFHGDYAVTLRDGKQLPLSRSYRDKVQEALGQTL